MSLPNRPPDAPVGQRAGGEDADEGRGRLPGVHMSDHGPSLSSPELVIAPLESLKVLNKGQVPRSVETLKMIGTVMAVLVTANWIYLDVFREEGGGDVRGRVSPPAPGGDEAGRGQVLAGREDRDDLVLSSLPPAAQSDGEYEHDGGDDGKDHGDHDHVEALAGEGDHLGLDFAVGTDEDLVVGGQVGLVQLAQQLPGPGDGRHRQAVGGEVVQVTQLGLVTRVRVWDLLRVSHQVYIRGVGAADVNLPLEVSLVHPGLVVHDEVVDPAVDHPGPPPLHQDVPVAGAVDVGDQRRAGLGRVGGDPPALGQGALPLGREGQHRQLVLRGRL